MGDREDLPAIQERSQNAEVVEFNPHEFLEERGIESLANRAVRDHEGNVVPLYTALVTCDSARNAIDAAVDMAKSMGDENVLPMMDRYLSKMEEKAAASAGAVEEAKKKDS
jgi:hypothetical protein